MAGTLGNAQEVLADAYAFIKANPQELFAGMLKLNVAGMALAMVALAPAGIIAFLVAGSGFLAGDWSQAAGPGMLALIGLGIPLMAVAALIQAAFKSAGYNLVADLHAGRRTDLAAQAKRNFVPVSKLMLLVWAALALLAVPLLLPLAVGGLLGVLAFCGLAILSPAACVVFLFLIQFSSMEVVLGGRGAVAAMKASAALARKDVLVVLLLDFVTGMISMAVSAPGGMAQTLMRPVLQVLAATGGAGMVAGFLAYLAAILAAYAVFGTVAQAACMPITYSYWKRNGGKANGD